MKIGALIHRFEDSTSTNDLAREMALGGAPEGTVVVAGAQTAGRGTKGRAWHSPPGLGLYMTVILRPSVQALALLPLAAGVACREAVLSSAGVEAVLKWPNDLLVSGRKLGGVLCEGLWRGDMLECALVGIGVNLFHSEEDFPPDLRATATSLAIVQGKPAGAEKLMDAFLDSLGVWYGILTKGREEDVLCAFEQYSLLSSTETVTVMKGGERFTGLYRGLNRKGGIVLFTEEKEVSFAPAEISEIIHG